MTCEGDSAVKAAPVKSAHRDSRTNPASCAIRSSYGRVDHVGGEGPLAWSVVAGSGFGVPQIVGVHACTLVSASWRRKTAQQFAS